MLGHALVLAILIGAVQLLWWWTGKLAAGQIHPRPRWQYLLFAFGYLGVTASLAWAGIPARGWVSQATGLLFVWTGFAGLVMIGRAASRGRVRRLFWWYRPPWLNGVP